VRAIKGVDIHDELVDIARKNSAFNASYEVDDILTFPFRGEEYKKMYIYDAMLHLTHYEFKFFLKRLSFDSSVAVLFVGGVLDSEKISNFWRNNDDKSAYFRSLENNVEFIGTWWYKDHMNQLCRELNLKSTIIDSPNKLYHSHYRYDMLIEF
jgi:hypothetical protein